jgi:putative PIN family toxin of toxin-antitoxin system
LCVARGSAAEVRIVLDTNVIVSALLKPESVPGRALAAVWEKGATVLYDGRVADEYREVLGRKKFASIDRAAIARFFAALQAHGEALRSVPPCADAMNDEDDRIFVEVAIAGRADAIVTGNLRDFTAARTYEIHPPAALLALLERRPPRAH